MGSRFSNYHGKLTDVADDDDERVSRPPTCTTSRIATTSPWNPKTKKYYRHGSCWEESHSAANIKRELLIDRPPSMRGLTDRPGAFGSSSARHKRCADAEEIVRV